MFDFSLCLDNSSNFATKDVLCFYRNTTERDFSAEQTLIAELGPKRKSTAVIVVLLFIYGVIFLTGVVGNVFTCIVIIRTSYMRTTTNYYLFSLAMSDVVLLAVG